MKIQITCEKCHGIILEGTGYKDAEHLARRFASKNLCAPVECPHCAKFAYGTLTEDMLAEAIVVVADKWNYCHLPVADLVAKQKSLAVDEARFVLRLMLAMEQARVNAGHPWQVDGERTWLLDLARKR